MSAEQGQGTAKRRRTAGRRATPLEVASQLVRQIRNTNSTACFNALQDTDLERDDIYEIACEQCKLHEALLAGLEAEASSTELQGASFAHFMFNCLLNGTRKRRGGGIGSADEQRSLNFLKSDVARAWPAWITCTLKMVERVFSEESPVPIQVARDLLVMTVYALSYQSIAGFVLGHHLASTWHAVKQTLLKIWDADERGILTEVNPGSSLEAYMNTIIAILREHATAIHGKEWTIDHLKIEDLGFVASEAFSENPDELEEQMMRARKFAMFSTLGIATARAHMETLGTVTMDDVNKHLEEILAESDDDPDANVSFWERMKQSLCCKRRRQIEAD